jgi:hypothetical protein
MDPAPPAQQGPPTEKEVRHALARLVVRGVEAVWSPELQPLLRLPAVRQEVAEAGEGSAPKALRSVLKRAVHSLASSQYRSLLNIVLGLDRQYEDMSAGEKREVAGREFRGGTKPVSAGTIRQHHEPRALDELASLLVSTNVALEARRPSPSDPILSWHPEVHRLWAGERLVFWRVSFSSFRLEKLLPALGRAMTQSRVRSWAAYELFGVFDLLIRAWVPAAEPEHTIRRNLEKAAEGAMDSIEAFMVDRIVTDWLWSPESGTPTSSVEDQLRHLPPPSTMERPGGDTAESALDAYEARGLILRSPPEPDGIRVFLSVSQGRSLVTSFEREMYESRLKEIAQSASALANVSIYAGVGFAEFLISGVVPSRDLEDLYQDLIQPLAQADPTEKQRTHTFVAMPGPVLQVEEIHRQGTAETRKAKDLLGREEGQRLEVKAAAFTGPRALARGGEPLGSTRGRGPVFDALAKVVVAFLNTEGGTVVVGAVEEGRVRKRHPDLSEKTIVTMAPEIGPYLVLGIDHELDRGVGWYERRLVDLLETAVDPDPTPYLKFSFEEIGGRTVCVIQVSKGSGWFYFKDKDRNYGFYVRRGAMVEELAGPELDRFKSLSGERS